MEPEVEVSVGLADVHLVEFPFMGPLDDPLVLHGIRQGEGLKDPGSIFADAVPDRLCIVTDGLEAVCTLLLDPLLQFRFIFLPLCLGHPGKPGFMGGLLPFRHPQRIEGIQDRPVETVSGLLE